jgi:hypothetical protein
VTERAKIRKPEISEAETITAVRLHMADAITDVLQKSGDYYDQLSDDELFGYATVLWDYHTDLRDEFSRRELMKATHTWAASTKPYYPKRES